MRRLWLVRLGKHGEVLDALFEVYDRLPEELRCELPLKRTWMLVPENEEGGA
jgi:restriction system protein